MAAPHSRTGFDQASKSLRRLGFRPCRTEKAPHLSPSSWKFAAVELKKGLTDELVVIGDCKAFGDTLTELVAEAEKRHGKDKPVTTEPTSTPPAPSTPEKIIDDHITKNKLAALETLLAGNTAVLDPEKLKEAIKANCGYLLMDASKELQDKWTNMICKTELALEAREKSVEEKIAAALRSVTTTSVTLNKPGQDPVVIKGQHCQFGILLRELSFGISCFLTGPAGSGKTTAALEAAKALGMNVFLMRAVLDPFELLGFIDAGGNYRGTPLYQWATTPNSILIMDEIDRSNPKAAIAINSAWNGVIPFPCGMVEVPKGNLVIATANTWGLGTDAEYVGSCRLDAATLNRFGTRIVWGYDESLESKLSGNPEEAAWCQRLRGNIQKRGIRLIFGPRDVIAHCRRIEGGVSREDSMDVSVLATMDSDTRKQVLSEVS